MYGLMLGLKGKGVGDNGHKKSMLFQPKCSLGVSFKNKNGF